MNNRLLAAIFLILIGIYFVSKWVGGSDDRSFDRDIITIDTARVSQLTFDMENNEGSITVKRMRGEWQVETTQRVAPAKAMSVKNILGTLSDINANRVVANSEDKWEDYEVQDGDAVLTVMADNETLAKFHVGRIAFNQQKRSGTSFVRLFGENEVYAVDGFLSITLKPSFESLVDKTVLDISSEDEINEVELAGDSLNYTISKSDAEWKIGDTALDSSVITDYLSKFSLLQGSEVLNNYDTTGRPAFQSISIKGDGFIREVKAYREGHNGFVLYNPERPSVYFGDTSGNLFGKIYRSANSFYDK
ncbi:MAG: DUF4340 domain-containing protein [Saprospiraceae bacterium]|nr:DUF4340 domain-containing protein [Saprospiraceae bacterium]